MSGSISSEKVSYFLNNPLINKNKPKAMIITGQRTKESSPKKFAPPKIKKRIKLIAIMTRLADKPSGFSLGDISVASAIPTPTKPGINAHAKDQVSQLPVKF